MLNANPQCTRVDRGIYDLKAEVARLPEFANELRISPVIVALARLVMPSAIPELHLGSRLTFSSR